MRKIVILSTGMLITLACLGWAADRSSPAEQFAAYFTHLMSLTQQQLSVEEQEALRRAHPMLLQTANNRLGRTLFWQQVRQSPAEAIEWTKAKELILGGKVVFVEQSHSLAVEIVTGDGRKYRTVEPKIDAVNDVMREVDPKSVFMMYATE